MYLLRRLAHRFVVRDILTHRDLAPEETGACSSALKKEASFYARVLSLFNLHADP